MNSLSIRLLGRSSPWSLGRKNIFLRPGLDKEVAKPATIETPEETAPRVLDGTRVVTRRNRRSRSPPSVARPPAIQGKSAEPALPAPPVRPRGNLLRHNQGSSAPPANAVAPDSRSRCQSCG